MSVRDWTGIQRKVAGIIYAEGWQAPCGHPAPVWYTDADGVGHCTLCHALWVVP
jgi:hypothetical protein